MLPAAGQAAPTLVFRCVRCGMEGHTADNCVTVFAQAAPNYLASGAAPMQVQVQPGQGWAPQQTQTVVAQPGTVPEKNGPPAVAPFSQAGASQFGAGAYSNAPTPQVTAAGPMQQVQPQPQVQQQQQPAGSQQQQQSQQSQPRTQKAKKQVALQAPAAAPAPTASSTDGGSSSTDTDVSNAVNDEDVLLVEDSGRKQKRKLFLENPVCKDGVLFLYNESEVFRNRTSKEFKTVSKKIAGVKDSMKAAVDQAVAAAVADAVAQVRSEMEARISRLETGLAQLASNNQGLSRQMSKLSTEWDDWMYNEGNQSGNDAVPGSRAQEGQERERRISRFRSPHMESIYSRMRDALNDLTPEERDAIEDNFVSSIFRHVN